MFAAIASVWALLVGVSFLMAGSGLQGSLLGIRASDAGFSGLMTGLIMSAYFAGFVGGFAIVPRLVRNVGHIRVFSALASIASAIAVLHSVFVDPIVWIGLRTLTGFCYIGIYIIAESWLNDRSTNENRGQILSVYMIVMTAAMAVGPLLLNIGDPSGFDLFIAASVLVSLSLVPVSLTTYSAPKFEEQDRLGIRELIKISPLGVAAGLTSGATAGALVWLASVYGDKIGMSLNTISLFVAASIVGGAVLQWPIGHLSDRFDRRRILTIVAFIGATCAVGATFVGTESSTIQMVAVALVGAFVAPIYSLSIAHTNDFLTPKQMVAASSGLLLANGIGGMIGPTVAGGAMQMLGPSGYFWFPAATMGALGTFALYRMTRRAAVPLEEQGQYISMPRTSGVFAKIALRDQMDRDIADMSRR
ncbi:MAG: MFS transporter [Rhodospirillaceae bacterium]|nr:MFS transporter [Rhodospirillaceae bacterium]|tara:strand:+ start:5592 stop:6848 length:1257 start_codon:yes stop_codon:yes gene_type:complete